LKRQKVEGRRQKVEGRRQKAEDKRQKAKNFFLAFSLRRGRKSYAGEL
jgi:hypothetical protein